MAPWVNEVELVHSKRVISDLGDFSHLREPARCAARIGQAFSDATHTLLIQPGWESEIPEIERNGRCFTDGCGTISRELLSLVWEDFGKTGRNNATVLQVRYRGICPIAAATLDGLSPRADLGSGAKGLLSLDSTLSGRTLRLRNSMIKFRGSSDHNLKINSANYKPLSNYLNTQFVTILQDLGVPEEAFLALQQEAIVDLQQILQTPINGARHLERNMITSGQGPALIRFCGICV